MSGACCESEAVLIEKSKGVYERIFRGSRGNMLFWFLKFVSW